MLDRLIGTELGTHLTHPLVEILKASFRAHGFWKFRKQPVLISSAFLRLPLVSQTFSSLAALAPSEQADEEAGMCVEEEEEKQAGEAQRAIPGFCERAPCTPPRGLRIPLSADLRSSIKRLESFRYRASGLEVTFQNVDCIWSVCTEKKCRGKGLAT